MRKRIDLGNYEISMCIEKNNPSVLGLDSLQVFHADFNIYKGDRYD